MKIRQFKILTTFKNKFFNIKICKKSNLFKCYMQTNNTKLFDMCGNIKYVKFFYNKNEFFLIC